ncbi:MAG: hypothetical protein H7334_03320 [Ferruginibacter sp.]|nr:hypothetical protein [Ferruginibacter sp.]
MNDTNTSIFSKAIVNKYRILIINYHLTNYQLSLGAPAAGLCTAIFFCGRPDKKGISVPIPCASGRGVFVFMMLVLKKVFIYCNQLTEGDRAVAIGFLPLHAPGERIQIAVTSQTRASDWLL